MARSPPVGKRKTGGNPVVNGILEDIRQAWGQPIAHRGKEAHFVKEALDLGYTGEQVLACWRVAQESPRWRGCWMPMAYLVEDLGEFVNGGGQSLRKWGGRVGRHPKEVDRKEYLRRYGHMANLSPDSDGEEGT